MKYIDADLLRKEIEKKQHICDGVFERGSDTYYQGKAVAYQETLAFIDSLQQEQPSKELEAEIDRLWESFADEMEGPHNLYDIYARLARHFANWQKSQMLKDAVEGYVNYYEDSGGILMAEAQVGCPYHNGDKVRIVVLKEEE